MNRSRSIVFIAGCILLVLSVNAIFLGVSRQGKQRVVINVLPTTARVTANESTISSGVNYLKPGTYTFVATATGFEPANTQETITTGSDEIVVDLLPTPLSVDAQKWVEQNQALYGAFEERSITKLREEGNSERDRHPILSQLPYEDPVYAFKIGYKGSGDDFTVTINAENSLERQVALGTIQGWGIDPAEYRIEFTTFKNPLEAL